MELHADRHTHMPEAVTPAATTADASDPAPQLRARRDPRFTHQDLRELLSLTRCLGEVVDQVSRDSVLGSSEHVDQGLSLLITSANRLSSVAANIRGIANAGHDQGGVFWEYFDVADLLQVLMVSTRALVGGKPVKVELVSAERPLTLWSDSGKVLQIASNLLENAAQHTDRGRITLILGRQQDHLTIMVTDTGKGMREAEVKRLIARMNGCAGRKASGRAAFGTGLARTRSLVEQLGGTLSLVSRWSEGTIVEVLLPLGPGRVERVSGPELPERSCA
jgi:signal transduction histidine kinase